MNTKNVIIALIILGLSLAVAGLSSALELDKGAMDTALRQELIQINDLELRQAILDEYKEVLRENMPELNIDEATCQSCEDDIKVIEKDLAMAGPKKENFLNDTGDKLNNNAPATTPTGPTIETPNIVEPIIERWYNTSCGCGGDWYKEGQQPEGMIPGNKTRTVD